MATYTKYSDMELISLLARDDRNAYAEIYDRFQGLLYVYACKVIKDSDEAEDVVQEVLIYLWDKRKVLKLTTSLSSYLYSAVRYKFINLLDHKRVRADYRESLQHFIDHGEYQTDNYIREKEFTAQIEKEIALLPEKMREIFVMSRKLNMSNEEIAQVLGVSEKTVRNQISNALKVLRAKLGLFTFLVHLVFR